MLTESPLLDALQLADAIRERFPAKFHPAIERALWGGIGDYYTGAGGHRDDGGHILVAISPIWCICPLREMALLC